jgi:hypothetical protein
MAFAIADIKSQLEFGGARPTQFSVRIFNPVNPIADIKSQFMIQAAQLPSSIVGQVEVRYFGRAIKLAGDREFDTWTVQVINDEDFLVKNAMEEWSNAINGHENNLRNFGGPQPSFYKSQAQVMQYSKVGNVIREYEFDGLWPLEIGAIDLSWESTNQIETFPVTFAYDSWRVIGGSTGNGGGF